jgi:hypothetical protein
MNTYWTTWHYIPEDTLFFKNVVILGSVNNTSCEGYKRNMKHPHILQVREEGGGRRGIT